MERYYRVKLNGQGDTTFRVATERTYEEMVKEYGDLIVGEESANGMLQRFRMPDSVKAEIKKLWLSMNVDNVGEVTQDINKLHQAALPDHHSLLDTMSQLHLDHYNNVIIPTLYPEENCKMYESPMLESVFPDLFFKLSRNGKPVADTIPRGVLPDMFKVVGGQTVVDTGKIDERARHMALAREANPVISKRVDAFREAFETQTVTSPDECGIHIPATPKGIVYSCKPSQPVEIRLPISGIVITLRPPTMDDLNQNIESLPQKSAYELWLEDGNVGTINDYIFECTRWLKRDRGSDFKETVQYIHNDRGGMLVIRKDNQGGFSYNTIPADVQLPKDLPEIKGVILKGSKPPIDDRDVRSQIEQFVEAKFEPALAAQVMEKLDTVAEVGKKELVDIIPPHLRQVIEDLKFNRGPVGVVVQAAIDYLKGTPAQEVDVDALYASMRADIEANQPIVTGYEEIFEEIAREKERRILIGTNVYGIQEQFLSFLKRCDEEQLNTATPSAFDRDHFDVLYQQNVEAIGKQLPLVLQPHLNFQGIRRDFMVDGAENNVFRVSRSCHGRHGVSYRQLVTIRFVKGFFNIEMH